MSLLQTPNIPTTEMARLLICLMRAMKPEKAPGAELNDNARLRAFMEQMSVNLTVAPFPTDVLAPLSSAYGYSVDNYGPEILQSLPLAATKGEPLVSKTARMYLQLAHRSREYRFRFCLTHIVHTHRTVMLHPAMRESVVHSPHLRNITSKWETVCCPTAIKAGMRTCATRVAERGCLSQTWLVAVRRCTRWLI